MDWPAPFASSINVLPVGKSRAMPMRKLRRPMTATFWIVAAVIAARNVVAQNDATDPQAMFNQAAQAYNAQKWLDAKAILAKLIESHPDHYQGHGLYWEVLGWAEDETARRAAVVRSLKQFEGAPPEKRNENFYFQAVKGYEILEDEARVGALKK